MSQRIPVVVPKNACFYELERLKTKPNHCSICGSKLKDNVCDCEEYTGYTAADRDEWLRVENEILAEYESADLNVPNAYIDAPNYMTGEKFTLVNVLLEHMAHDADGHFALRPRRKGNQILIPVFEQYAQTRMFRFNIPEWEEFYEAETPQNQNPQTTT